jgi:hypothetical protein
MCVIRAIKAWTLNPAAEVAVSAGTPSYETAVTRALESQRSIGWEHIFRGFISSEWGQIYIAEDKTPPDVRQSRSISLVSKYIKAFQDYTLFCGRAGTTSFTKRDRMAWHRFTRRSTTTYPKCTRYATHSPQSYEATSKNPSRNDCKEPLDNGRDGYSLQRSPHPIPLQMGLDKPCCHIFSNMQLPITAHPLPAPSSPVPSPKYQPSCNKYQ